jgi:hypothetical protein
MPNPVVHFEILGKDKKALTDFYKQVFQWQIQPAMEEYSLVNTGSGIGGGIGGGIGAMGESRIHVTFYIAVENLESTLSAIEAQGGQKAFGPHPIPDGGIIAGFLDPEGHLIGLIQPAPGMTPQA